MFSYIRMLRYFFRVKLSINLVRIFFPGLLHHLLSELTTLTDWPTANSIKPSPVNGLWRSGQFELGCVSQQSEPAATRLDQQGIGGVKRDGLERTAEGKQRGRLVSAVFTERFCLVNKYGLLCDEKQNILLSQLLSSSRSLKVSAISKAEALDTGRPD